MQNKLKVNGYSTRDILIVLGVILLSKSLYYETYGGNYLLIAFFFLLAFIVIPNIKNFKVDKKTEMRIVKKVQDELKEAEAFKVVYSVNKEK